MSQWTNASRKWERNKELFKLRRLATQYKVEIRKLKKMQVNQQNKCAICENETKLFVDHNHQTGKVRGFLCNMCNSGLGLFKDNITLMKKATEYLWRRLPKKKQVTERMKSMSNEGRKLRNQRKGFGLNQSELAKHLGFTRAAINNWERGKNRPSPLAAKKIQEILGK